MPFEQVGVVPYRKRASNIEVLLVTTRKRGRWIFPKGNVEDELGNRGSARLEALEEAGVDGRLHSEPLGTYRHGSSSSTKIRLYLMEVEDQHETWPEEDERRREWLPLEQARQRVDERGLRPLLDVAARRLEPALAKRAA